jgi:septal ring factor EnvC (AmiA/AmiB activator)
MKHIITALLVISFLASNTTTVNKKIKKTNHKLVVIKKQYKNTYKNFKKTAKKIISQEKTVASLGKKISKLKLSLQSTKKGAKQKNIILSKYEKSYRKTLKEKEEQERKLVDYIAEHLSFSIVASNKTNDPSNIITQEFFEEYKDIVKEEVNELAKDISTQQIKIDAQSKNIKIIKSQLRGMNSELKKLDSLSKRKAKVIKNLKQRKINYGNELKNIRLKRRKLSSILSKLKIVKRQPRKKQKTKRSTKRTNKKTVASSYQNVRTYNYHGAKTIAPLKKFVVLRKYGPYQDPIYNIKIFNDSIVMKPIGRNQKVNAVLTGKVIFAKKTPSLKKVVIIQHKNKYHTIYAHLDKIAPTIKRGKIVKKGFVIGKVNSSLTFQITKQNYYINPLKFIKY